MKESFELQEVLLSFFHLGCACAELCCKNILYYDFHEGNVFIEKHGKVHLLDMDGVEFIDFPKEIEQYASGIINLYTNFNLEHGAAFRFGFITVLGKTGALLFDILYNRYGLTTQNEILNKRLEAIDTDEIKREFDEWIELTSHSFVGQATKNTLSYDEFSFIELMERNLTLYHSFKEKYKSNNELLRHEYNVYIAHGLYKENSFDVIGAALSLCQIDIIEGQYFTAAYYIFLVKTLMLGSDRHTENYESLVQHVTSLFVSKFGVTETQNIFEFVTHESLRLLILRKGAKNFYYDIWYWSEFALEHSITEYILEKPYGCYFCQDCSKFEFYNGNIDKCFTCGSANIKLISLDMYMQLIIEKLLQEGEPCSKEVAVEIPIQEADLPDLNRIEHVSLYIGLIKQYKSNKQYTQAIQIAHRIESFLHDTTNIRDENGYLVDKVDCGSKIFYSPLEPKSVMKLFFDERTFVRYDYESYIYAILCELYQAQNADTEALKYANIILNLANNSRRWINKQYIVIAVQFLRDYYSSEKSSNEALKYANILFIYQMLETIEVAYEKESGLEISELILSLMDIGQSYADDGNFWLAFPCYVLALKMHVFSCGEHHPDSAIIYSKLAELWAHKGLLDIAYKHWVISIKLLASVEAKRYEDQIDEIKSVIVKTLRDNQYTGTYEKWQEEWLTSEASSIFRENRYVKKDANDGKLPEITISKEDLLNDYVVLI